MTWAFRIAGVLILLGIPLSLFFPTIIGDTLVYPVAAIDLVIAGGLLFLQPWGRSLAIARPVTGAILFPVLALFRHSTPDAILAVAVQLGYLGTLLLLLLGHPRTWRLAAAVLFYLVFVILIPFILMVAFAFQAFT